MATIEQRSMRSARLSARAPRWALLTVCAVLSLKGLVGIVRPAPAPVVVGAPRSAPATVPVGAAGFAEGFVRAYLSYDVAAPERRELALRPYVGGDLDEQAGFSVPLRGAQRATWTATVGQRRLDATHTAVTVAAALDGADELRHLAVVVARDRSGALAVTAPPAVVGVPATPPAPRGRDGDDVEDESLRAVVARALGNFLAGQRENLRADLAPGARMPVPAERLRLTDVTKLSDLGRGQVAALVVAEDARGGVYTLRYELAVTRRDRWYVAGLLTHPPDLKERAS
jgi:Conjugative transposon protein TcpC